MTVEFKYEINDKVKTPLGVIGIIDMCAKDNGGMICYYVSTVERGVWCQEGILEPCPQEK